MSELITTFAFFQPPETSAAVGVAKKSNIPKRKMPNFAKLHEQNFNKMDTLETYLSKKKVSSYNRSL